MAEVGLNFRPVTAADFALLHHWLNQPHLRRFYQKTPIGPEEIAEKYGPRVRGEEAGVNHLACLDGRPYGYLQGYRNLDWPAWAELIGVDGGLSIDLYIGEPDMLGGGHGRAMLAGYLQVLFSLFPDEWRCYIAHAVDNKAALACSGSVGFKPVRRFVEDGIENQLLAIERG